jgi:hypothetical protein
MKTCSQCHEHYVALGEGKNGKGETVQVGNCFRYPPKVTVTGSSAYPVVGADERQCGEFSSTRRKATK